MRTLPLRRKLFFSVLLVGASTFTTLVFSEILLRAFLPQSTGPVMFAFDPRLGQIPVPNQKGRRTLSGVFDYRFENDSDGMRKTGYTARGSERLRMLFLGDSFTYGAGVDDSQTFAYLAEKGLSTAASPVAVYNAGNPGTGTDYAVHLLQARGSEVKPDLILIAFFPNDFGDNLIMRHFQRISVDRLVPANPSETFAFFRKKGGLINSPMYNWVVTYSHLANLLRRFVAWSSLAGGWGNLTEFVQNKPNLEQIKHGFASERAVTTAAALFSWADKEATRLKSELVFAYVPTFVEVEGFRRTGETSADERAFENALVKIPRLRLSFTAPLASSHVPVERLYFTEGHWNSDAHRIAADYLTVKLKPVLERRMELKNASRKNINHRRKSD